MWSERNFQLQKVLAEYLWRELLNAEGAEGVCTAWVLGMQKYSAVRSTAFKAVWLQAK